MRRALSIGLLVTLFFVIYQISAVFLINTHDVSYQIKTDELVFDVTESFKDNRYLYVVQSGEYKFIWSSDNSFNKMKKTISKIEYQTDGELLCVYPIYIKEKQGSIRCSNKKQVYTEEALENNPLLLGFKSHLRNDKLMEDLIEAEAREKDKVIYYPDNLDNSILTLWNYNGFLLLEKDYPLNYETYSFDRYDNTLGTLVKQYYVTPVYMDNTLFEFDKVLAYDIVLKKEFEIVLPFTMSNSTYVNGVYQDKLYLFDKNNLKQVSIDLKHKEAGITSDERTAVFYDKTLDSRNIYDFVSTELHFSLVDDTELKKMYSYISSYEDDDCYYFYDGSSFYQVYKDYLDIPVLLLRENMKEIKVKNHNIYYVNGNTIYRYQIGTGKKRLVVYDELIYNDYNIYDIY